MRQALGWDSGARRRRTFAAMVATTFAESDAPCVLPVPASDTVRGIDESIAAMPDVTRLGVRCAGVATWVLLTVLGRRPFGRQPPEVRQRTLRRLVRARLPLVGDYLRLARGLGSVTLYESPEPVGRP